MQAQWIERIERSGEDKSTVIDLSGDLLLLFQKFIMILVFGDHLNDVMIAIRARKGDGSFERYELGIQDAVQEVFE